MVAFLNKSFQSNGSFIIYIFLSLTFPKACRSTEWTLVEEDACFSASTVLYNHTFNPTYTGTVSAVKLVHTSGSVTCGTNHDYSNWGCLGTPLVYLVEHHDDGTVHEVLPTVDTLSGYGYYSWNYCSADDGNKCTSWGYTSSGQDADSAELVWTDSTLNLYVSTSDILSLQYSEACCEGVVDLDGGGNDGLSCAKVYFQYDSTPSPTTAPSASPTSSPTDTPSVSPTTAPSLDPTADPSTVPTTKPTVGPTTDPTVEPTTNPTMIPTAAPTNSPSTTPSLSPTMSPISCDYIYVQIDNLHIFTSAAIEHQQPLQDSMANITHFAISENAKVLGISREQFYVQFQNVSEPLYMVHTLCTFAPSTLQILLSLINSDGDEISASIEQRLIALYDLSTKDAPNVTVATEPFLTQSILGETDAATSADVEATSLLPWILLIIGIVMVAFIGSLVVFLLMRRKNLILQREMGKSASLSAEKQENVRRVTRSSIASQPSMTDVDPGTDERAEGMQGTVTGGQDYTIQEGVVGNPDL